MPIAATNALLKVLGHTSKQVTDYNFILLNELQKNENSYKTGYRNLKILRKSSKSYAERVLEFSV